MLLVLITDEQIWIKKKDTVHFSKTANPPFASVKLVTGKK